MKANKTLRQAVREALLAPWAATFGALVSQHPVTLAWDYFNKGESPHTAGVLWYDLMKDPEPGDDIPRILIGHDLAKEAQTVTKHHSSIEYMVEAIVTGHEDDEEMLIELTESNGKLLELLAGVLDTRDMRELIEMRDLIEIQRIVEIHGTELFDWIEEYMIDHESDGYHKLSIKSFVNGIRYFIFYHLAGKEHGKTRVTHDMVSRLTSVTVGITADAWGVTLDKGDASEDEAKAFREMIRHGITEERIERLQELDYIIDEPEE